MKSADSEYLSSDFLINDLIANFHSIILIKSHCYQHKNSTSVTRKNRLHINTIKIVNKSRDPQKSAKFCINLTKVSMHQSVFVVLKCIEH